jgi:hypothetical protein
MLSDSEDNMSMQNISVADYFGSIKAEDRESSHH